MAETRHACPNISKPRSEDCPSPDDLCRASKGGGACASPSGRGRYGAPKQAIEGALSHFAPLVASIHYDTSSQALGGFWVRLDYEPPSLRFSET
jgi:hypothetical protein